ncbi:MAG: tol-pal system-associated acyl-CoA thioesterase [Pseudomonadota bacterium]
MAHRHSLRVYYEDTDLAGVVYYANYLRFIERGRSEALRALGIDQVALERDGLVFVVRRIEAEYRRPARFDDVLEVVTRLQRLGGASVSLDQTVLRAEELLFVARVQLAVMGRNGRPQRLPDAVREALGRLGA